VQHLIDTHYTPHRRALRRCHARDFMKHLRNYCTYHNTALEMQPEYLDTVSRSLFAAGFGDAK
jgi:hypothetical protein